MVKICAIASGSNGNCYYIGNETSAVIIDIGISNRQLTKRLKSVGLSAKKIRAVFITHEHTDHIKGMQSITSINPIQAFATKKTCEKARKDYLANKVNYFTPGDTINIENIKVHSFSKHHNAAEPVSFRVEIDNINIAVLTDLGFACDNVKEHLQKCDAAFLEANYDYDLLMAGKYRQFIKARVASNKGHLSNEQASKLVESLDYSPLKTIILSHISADNNRTDLAIKAFDNVSDKINIYGSSRYGTSELIELDSN